MSAPTSNSVLPANIVILDTRPLGLVSNPKATPDNDACRAWLYALVAQGRRVIVPEIADYEARHELLRAGKPNGILRLDRVKNALKYMPITTSAMLLGAGTSARAADRRHPCS